MLLFSSKILAPSANVSALALASWTTTTSTTWAWWTTASWAISAISTLRSLQQWGLVADTVGVAKAQHRSSVVADLGTGVTQLVVELAHQESLLLHMTDIAFGVRYLDKGGQLSGGLLSLFADLRWVPGHHCR